MISFTFDKASVIGAMKAHAQAELNLELEGKVCDVDVSVGRKTPSKPDPDVTVTFKVYDAEDTTTKPVEAVVDVPVATETEEQAPVEEQTDTAAPSEEALKEATTEIMVDSDDETKTEEQVDSLFSN